MPLAKIKTRSLWVGLVLSAASLGVFIASPADARKASKQQRVYAEQRTVGGPWDAPQHAPRQRGLLDAMRSAGRHCARGRSGSFHSPAASARCKSLLRRRDRMSFTRDDAFPLDADNEICRNLVTLSPTTPSTSPDAASSACCCCQLEVSLVC